MLNLFRARKSNVLVWILMGMLIVGLAGFGIGVGGGLTTQVVASVGDRDVTADAYARALDQELRAITAQIGRSLPMAEARQFGVDRMVLARLVNDAALDDEADRLGLSSGDEVVRRQIMSTPGFQGLDGSFDRQTYTAALQRAGLTTTDFEQLLRREATRELVVAGVQASARLPDTAALTVLDFLGERRAFDWLRLDETLLEAPVPEPTEADLAGLHAAEPGRYTRPETRRVTYAFATPESIAAGIEIPEGELRAAYDAERDRFATPERRILDRIGFGSTDEAAEAKARLDAGEISFDALATERGLGPADLDQGTVAAAALSEAAREAVFGAPGPGIVGPAETPLGPSLYRVNAILDARTTSFEAAREELRQSAALEQAEQRMTGEIPGIEDLIAGGATLEEIAAETVLELGTIALDGENTEGLANDEAFRALVAETEPGPPTDLADLDAGGVVTLRVDAIEEPTVIPLDEIRDQVAADWRAARIGEALSERAETLAGEIAGVATLDAIAERLGLPLQAAGPLTRGDVVPDAPPRLVADIFEAEPDGTTITANGAEVILAQLTEIAPFDPAAPDNTEVVATLRQQFDDQAADDVLALYTAALRDTAGVRVNQDLLETTLAQFP